MKKNLISCALICALTAALLSGCSTDEATTTQAAPSTETQTTESTHEHAAEDGWERNGTEHWQMCACGEKIESSEHALGDDSICTVCGSEIWDFGDVEVRDFDEYGNWSRVSSYSSDGELLNEITYKREYDASGNLLLEQYFDNGIMTNEDVYAVNSDGESYITSSTSFQEDGSKYINQYDAEGNITVLLSYDADGVLIYESYSEYACTEDGEWYEAKATNIEEDGAKLIAEYNKYGDIISRIRYNADGSTVYSETYEYEYNDEGEQMWIKEYEDGRIVYEVIGYAVMTTEDYSMRYPTAQIYYNEDGTKAIFESGENGEIAKETYYGADGSVERVVSYIYEYDDDGNWTDIKVFDGDMLIKHTEYELNEDGWSYKALETEYQKDGGKTVFEFDEYEELISETVYDAAGNVVP